MDQVNMNGFDLFVCLNGRRGAMELRNQLDDRKVEDRMLLVKG